MNYTIEKLDAKDFSKCKSIWSFKQRPDLAESFLKEIKSGNRITFVYKEGEKFIGEGSIVFDMHNSAYTVKNKRIYFSHFMVKSEYRNKGIGSVLAKHIFDYCKKAGYSEISLCVVLKNFNALRLYHRWGFNDLVFLGEDIDGKFVTLLKRI